MLVLDVYWKTKATKLVTDNQRSPWEFMLLLSNPVLARIKIVLSHNDFENVTQAFISPQLDDCNALYVGVNQSILGPIALTITF